MTDAAVHDTLHDEDLPFSPDPVGDWIRANFTELMRYSGQYVAIDPARGIVAADPEVRGLHARLAALGVPQESDDVEIHWVR